MPDCLNVTLQDKCVFTFTQVRKLISDFAIILAILIFCGVDMLVGVDTPKLIVPSEFKVSFCYKGAHDHHILASLFFAFDNLPSRSPLWEVNESNVIWIWNNRWPHFLPSLQPTSPLRGWFVPPFGGNPWWVYLASSVPALLVTILIFMDQQITAVIVNRKEHKLKVSLTDWMKTVGRLFQTTFSSLSLPDYQFENHLSLQETTNKPPTYTNCHNLVY